MNKKSLFVVLLLCGLILASLVIRNGRLLILGIPFLTYLLVGVIQAPVTMKLSAQRVIEEPNALAQEPIRADLVVRNEGGLLKNLYLNDEQAPGSLSVLDGKPDQHISLPAGASVALSYTFHATRGVYVWNSMQAIASDPLGLFDIKKDIPAAGALVVRPPSMMLNHSFLKPQTTLHAPGPIAIALAGSSTDFLGIREYRAGDSLRRLNWRLAARHPHELFTNEYEREEIADFGLVLDARRLSNADGVEDTLFEASIQVTLSLSEMFLKEGNRVALLVFGQTMSFLFPGYGKRQLNKITRDLAEAKLGSNLSLEHLQYFPTRLFPSRSILIVVSPVGMHDEETYARLRSFGYDIVLISPDPVDCIGQRLPDIRINRLAVRAARLERIVQLKQIMKLGVQVVDWQVTRPFETVFQQAMKMFAQRRKL